MIKNIVILGAGFGGLRAALNISRSLKKNKISNYKVVLLDRLDHHTFTPLLYEAATAHKKYFLPNVLKSLIAYPITEILKSSTVEFQKDEVENINLHDRFIKTRSSSLSFEYLVLALGSEVVYFGIPGLKENSFHLKTSEDALGIRARLEVLIQKETPVRIVIGGGGSTGVELAAEIAKLTRRKRKNIEILLLEATPTILPGFDKRVIKKVHERLTSLAVKVMIGNPVASISFNEVKLKDGASIHHDFFIWTGGVGASSLTEQVSVHVKKGEKNRLEISNDLTCKPQDLSSKMHGIVYAIGDIACILNPELNRMVPLIARAAIEEGKIVAKNIISRIKEAEGKTLRHERFHYIPKEYPYIIPVGGKYAIAKIGSVIMSGFIGWVFKILVELNYFRTIMPLWKAKRLWLQTLVVFSKND